MAWIAFPKLDKQHNHGNHDLMTAGGSQGCLMATDVLVAMDGSVSMERHDGDFSGWSSQGTAKNPRVTSHTAGAKQL